MKQIRFTDGERHVFRKRPYEPLSEWAAANLLVKDGPYAGGRYRKDVNPYLVEIMDTWSHPDVEEVGVCGSAQTGKTLVMHAALAYSVVKRPGPRMLAMQDDESLGKVVSNKLLPMFRASRPVRDLLAKERSGQITFRDSTTIYLASAQSPNARASISIQDLMLDEEALYRQITGQGVPALEFLERTRSYSNTRKVLRESKPIGGDECSIVLALEEYDEVRHYEARCPACMQYNELVEDNLAVTEKGVSPQEVERRKLGRYRCKCGYLWTDHMRDRAVNMGRWVAADPVPHPRKVGFVLPAILSKNVSLSEIMAAKMRAEASDSPALKQHYINGMWAKPYRAVVQETEATAILKRIDKNLQARTVPGDVVALTAGVDSQARGFWYTIWGWKPNLASVLVDYGRLPDWDAVHALLFETRYDYEADGPMSGRNLGIWRAGIDSGGTRSDDKAISRTEDVYRWVRKYGGKRIFACKGASHESVTPVRAVNIDRFPSSRMRILGGLWLYLLDTHYFKSLLFARLAEDARQPITLHKDTDQMFADQLSAESLQRDRNGKLVWVAKRRANHLLDCSMMAHACVDGSWLPSLNQLLEREAAQKAMPVPKLHSHLPEPKYGAAPQRHLPQVAPGPAMGQRELPQRVMAAREAPQRAVNRPGFMRRSSDF